MIITINKKILKPKFKEVTMKEYKIAVVEKFGYGFSDDSDRSRDIDTMLDDTRLKSRRTCQDRENNAL